MRAFLDAETLEFIQSGEVALYVAGCDAFRRSHAVRAFTCRPSEDGRSLTTWVARSAASAVLADVASNARLAFTVSHIDTCRTLQLKSVDAQVLPADSADYARIIAYQDGFVRQTMSLGYLEAVVRSTIQLQLHDLAAIRFTPSSAFMQTPGPGAGAALGQDAREPAA